MAKSVTGGRGVTGINYSGKENRLDRNTTTAYKTSANPVGRRYLEAIGPVKPKSVPRTYVPAPLKPKPVVAVKPPAKKPVTKKVVAKPAPASARARTVASPKTMFNRPPATRFGVVTGKTTGTSARGGGGYGGGGTSGSGSLSGQGSGTRSAGTSRTGGTQRNDPVRG